METIRKIRTILLLVLGVPALLFIAGIIAWDFIKGDGAIVLVAPPQGTLTYVVDDLPPHTLNAGQFVDLKLKQGPHTVRTETEFGKAERVAEIKNGMSRMLVPADEGQCFVLLDISKSHFVYGSKKAERYPEIRERINAKGELFDMPGSSVYFSERSIPRSLKEGNRCDLLEEVECEDLALADEALMNKLGFGDDE